jgi:hypothetical protein
MGKAAIYSLLLVLPLFVFGACLVSQPQMAHASYDSECKAAGGSSKTGGSTALVWDGVGLRWCCVKRMRGFHGLHTSTLWCKS